MLGWKRIKYQVLEQDHQDDSSEGNYFKLFVRSSMKVTNSLTKGRKEMSMTSLTSFTDYFHFIKKQEKISFTSNVTIILPL